MVQTPTLESQIRWELLPKDFILPDEPVDNINQPSLAAALTESLVNADKLTPESITTTNYGICVQVEQQFVVKAPDWAYIPRIAVPKTEIERSYTPQVQGDIPAIVMEFLSETEGGEYSIKP
ncbi:MAG: Uma2 family endonuclease, partial [Snowella sp.]